MKRLKIHVLDATGTRDASTYLRGDGTWAAPTGGGTVDSVVPGANIDVDSTDPANPIVSVENLTAADLTDVTASATELNFVDGVTSAIQTQIDGKQPLDSDLTTIAGLPATTDNFMQAKSSAWASRTPAQVAADLALPVAAVGKTINAQTGTSYTLVLGDAGKFVTMSNAAASTLTVPPNSSVAFPVGTVIEGAQLGAGQVTLTQGAGVTINATPGLKIAAQYGSYALIKLATDTWLAVGRLAS